MRVVSGHWKVLMPLKPMAIFFCFPSVSTSMSLCNDVFRINYHSLKGVRFFSPPTSWAAMRNLDFTKTDSHLYFPDFISCTSSALSRPAGVHAEDTCGASEPSLSLEPPSVHPPKRQVGSAINKVCPLESVGACASRQLRASQ